MGFNTAPYGAVLGIEDAVGLIQHTHDHLLPSSSSSSSSSLPVELLQSLSSDLHKQTLEMDWFLQLQSKRLRRSIQQEEARRQAYIIQECESKLTALILQKEEQSAAARSRTRELTETLKMAEMEARAWQKIAAEKEAVATDLNNRLMNMEHDAMSFCGSSSSPPPPPAAVVAGKMECRLCGGGRVCCVVFFPCRHVCCCKQCEPLLGHCPFCCTVKEASLEVFLV
ncbi:hypothetical protein ABFX02_03G073600 [Erythranthe guttata]